MEPRLPSTAKLPTWPGQGQAGPSPKRSSHSYSAGARVARMPSESGRPLVDATSPKANKLPQWPPRSTQQDATVDMINASKRQRMREDEDIRINGPRKRFNAAGFEIDGNFSKDPAVMRWGVIVFLWLLLSWTAQWAMFALPNWRADMYHHGGLFQVCGNAELQFNPSPAVDSSGNPGSLTIKSKSMFETCVPVEDYVSQFLTLVQPDKNDPKPSDRFYNVAQYALPHIQASRYLEAIGTLFDMIFGVGTLLLVCKPAQDERIEARNAAITFGGILLMPWFPVFDILISFSYWDALGVGYFQATSGGGLGSYTSLGPVVSLFTSWFDFVIQIWFLTWGLKRLLGANKRKLRDVFLPNSSKEEEAHTLTLFPKSKGLGI